MTTWLTCRIRFLDAGTDDCYMTQEHSGSLELTVVVEYRPQTTVADLELCQ